VGGFCGGGVGYARMVRSAGGVSGSFLGGGGYAKIVGSIEAHLSRRRAPGDVKKLLKLLSIIQTQKSKNNCKVLLISYGGGYILGIERRSAAPGYGCPIFAEKSPVKGLYEHLTKKRRFTRQIAVLFI